MKVLDTNNQEIFEYDLTLGYLKSDKIFIAHHEAVEAVEEQGHEEIIAEYRNAKGEVYGRDVAWIVDVPACEAKDAWDEYEDIMRYTPYTDDELAEIKDAIEKAELVKTNEELTEENEMLKAKIQALSGQMDFYEECLVEMANLLYA